MQGLFTAASRTDGKIQFAFICEENDDKYTQYAVENFIFSGKYADSDYYVDIIKEEIKKKPECSWSKYTILDDGIDYAEILLPAGSTLTINNQTYTFETEETVQFNCNEIKSFQYTLDLPFPWKNSSGHISVVEEA